MGELITPSQKTQQSHETQQKTKQNQKSKRRRFLGGHIFCTG